MKPNDGPAMLVGGEGSERTRNFVIMSETNSTYNGDSVGAYFRGRPIAPTSYYRLYAPRMHSSPVASVNLLGTHRAGS